MKYWGFHTLRYLDGGEGGKFPNKFAPPNIKNAGCAGKNVSLPD
jgi:hypothetical protein